MHPATIDNRIQALLLAGVKGLCRNFDQLIILTLIESIETWPGENELSVFPETEGSFPRIASGTVECVTEDNKLSLWISGVRVTALDGDTADSSQVIDRYAAARLHWMPDIDFADDVSHHFTLLSAPTS
mgnify:CR=1 FL=1